MSESFLVKEHELTLPWFHVCGCVSIWCITITATTDSTCLDAEGDGSKSYPLHSPNYRSSECSFLSRVLSILLDAVTVLTGPPAPRDGSSCSLMTEIPKNEPFLEWWGAKSVIDPLKTVFGFPRKTSVRVNVSWRRPSSVT